MNTDDLLKDITNQDLARAEILEELRKTLESPHWPGESFSDHKLLGVAVEVIIALRAERVRREYSGRVIRLSEEQLKDLIMLCALVKDYYRGCLPAGTALQETLWVNKALEYRDLFDSILHLKV